MTSANEAAAGKWMPEEPTNAMLLRAQTKQAAAGYTPQDAEWLADIYRAMYAAFASPEPAPAGEWQLVPTAALKWLLGEGPDDRGCHFGDDCYGDLSKRPFWWRSVFNRMLAAAAPPPPDALVGELVKALAEALEEARQIATEALGNDYEPETCPRPNDDLCGDRYCQAIGCIADKYVRIDAALARAKGAGHG